MREIGYFDNNLEGLMGNSNKDPTDDIFARNGSLLSNITSERAIFPYASTCNYKKLTKKEY